MNSADTVLVLTGTDDPTADAVIAELAHRDVRIARIDTGQFPMQMQLAARGSADGWSSQLRTEDGLIDLDLVQSVYYRRPTHFVFSEAMSAADRAFAAAEARLGVGGVFATLDAMWVNDPAKVAVAEYKPAQLQAAARSHLSVPRTLVTNDPAEARSFAEDIGAGVVCKTLSSLVLSHNGQHRITYTTKISATDIDIEGFATTAHLVQEWVEKAFEVRVTMLGARPLATAIHANSEAAHVDWRADYDALRYEPIDVPDAVTAGMTHYLEAFGLNYGAFDFVVSPEGEWVFLECNPAGQWLWLEHEVGLPIAAAMADLLTEGAAR